MLHQVPIGTSTVDRFLPLIGEERLAQVQRSLRKTRAALRGRVIWHINSTPSGGGVAEVLRGLLPYVRGGGIETRWLVVQGNEAFFRITKRLHHALHGYPGDRSALGDEQRRHYEATLTANAETLRGLIHPGAVVVLHDPQTAGLIPALKQQGATVIWRCHIGTDLPNDESENGWRFLAPYLGAADAAVFSRSQYVPDASRDVRTVIIPPSIDPFSTKNRDLRESSVRAILVHTGIVEGPDGSPAFVRSDGSAGRVDRQADIIRLGPAPLWDTPMVVQVSRWDSLKDHVGVMNGFVQLTSASGVQGDLVLAGPNVHGVADDPEQAVVLDSLISSWRRLSHSDRSRVHLVCLPTADVDENAAIVNALQRHAAVVAQKSLAEGFGLTVTEAMWKARPVVASAVGGIADQIEDGVNGLLIRDPTDLGAFANCLREVLEQPQRALALGSAAHDAVLNSHLVLRELLQYGELLRDLLAHPSGERVRMADLTGPK